MNSFPDKYTGAMYFRPKILLNKFKAEFDSISVTSNFGNPNITVEGKEVILPVGPNGIRIGIENNRDEPVSLISYKGQWVGELPAGGKVEVEVQIERATGITFYALGGIIKIPPGDAKWVGDVLDVKVAPRPTVNASNKNRIKNITNLLKESKVLTVNETEFLLSLPLKQFKLLPKEIQDWLSQYQGLGSTDLPTEKIHELEDKRSIRLKD